MEWREGEQWGFGVEWGIGGDRGRVAQKEWRTPQEQMEHDHAGRDEGRSVEAGKKDRVGLEQL